MNKLAIVGSGSLTREHAPFDDESFDIWVFNEAPLYDWCKRYTASFQLHKPEVYTGPNVKKENYWTWLQQETKPVFMNSMDNRVPGCEVYPLDEALKLGGFRFFGMTISYALALGIIKGYEQIEVRGIELSATEYQYGMDTWAFWVGFAKVRLNGNFVLHSGEKLFDYPLYGIDGGQSFDKDFFAKRIQFLENGWKSADKHLQGLRKCFEKYIKENEFDKTINTFVDFEKAALEAGELAGALSAAEKWNKEDWVISRNEFETEAAKAQRDGDDQRSLMLHNGGMIDYVFLVWKQTGDNRVAGQLIELINKHLTLAYDTGALHGSFVENQSYIMKYDDLALAGGVKVKAISESTKAVLYAN